VCVCVCVWVSVCACVCVCVRVCVCIICHSGRTHEMSEAGMNRDVVLIYT
jgi:hypothetical protein